VTEGTALAGNVVAMLASVNQSSCVFKNYLTYCTESRDGC
jgi:hypothetical protein